MGMESCHIFCVTSFLWANQPLPSNPFSYPCHQGTQGNPARQVRLVSRCSKDGPAWIQEMEVAKATHDTRQEDPIPDKMLTNSSKDHYYMKKGLLFLLPWVFRIMNHYLSPLLPADHMQGPQADSEVPFSATLRFGAITPAKAVACTRHYH